VRRIGVVQWCLDRAGADALHRASELGFAAVHVDAGGRGGAPVLAGPEAQRYRRAAEEAGLSVTAVAANLLNDLGLHRPAGSVAARQAWDAVRWAVEAAAGLGAGLVMLPSFRESLIRTERDLLRTAEVLRDACAYAAADGTLVATENSLGAEGNLRLLEAARHPNLRVLVDSLNPVLHGHAVPELVRAVRPHLCDQFHAKDGSGATTMGDARLGTGWAGLAATARALREVGFHGDVVLENDYRRDARHRVARDVVILESLFGPGAADSRGSAAERTQRGEDRR
jgi:sugar phosphate isomerase/epimerase